MTGQFIKTADSFEAGSRTLDGRYYTSPEVFALEQERIFAGSWICVGREEQLPHPGDYFTCQVAGESLLVLREPDGTVIAFFNVCRHRGTRLCSQDSGKFPATIQCPYHAWTYNLRGELTGAPLMDEVPGFSKADFPLHKAQLALWQGFVYVKISAGEPTFDQVYATLQGKFASWNLPALRVLRRIDYDVKANWKLVVQNYSECYHCPLIHPDLARRSPYRSGRNDLTEGPFLGGFMDLNHEYGSLTMSGRMCSLPIGGLPASEADRVYYYTLFPGMLLSLHPDYVMCHTLLPVSPSETHIRCEWLFDPAASRAPGFDPDDAVRFWDMTNRQDWQVCELSQLGVSSRRYSPSPYGTAESLLAAFDRQYLRALEDNPD